MVTNFQHLLVSRKLPKAGEITNITDEMLEGQMGIKEALKGFIDFINIDSKKEIPCRT